MKPLIKLLFLIPLICALVGCVGITYEADPITMRIISIEKIRTGFWAGCGDDGYKTYLKSGDGHIDCICGRWGKIGDEISGFWHTGHFDGASNGFKRFR